MNNFGDYLAFLKDIRNPEWQEFVNALTTNLTAFFQEAHHFPILAKHARKKRAGGVYRVWCAASTGEEPYSIAMTLRDVLGITLIKPKLLPAISILMCWIKHEKVFTDRKSLKLK